MLRADFKYISTYNYWQDTERIMPMNLFTDQGVCSESHLGGRGPEGRHQFLSGDFWSAWSASYSLTHPTPTLVSLKKGGC